MTKNTDNRAPWIAYAAKSTQDVRGSIPTQLEDCRALAQREGATLTAEYQDEAASAYSGSRGPGLASAFEHAERLAAEHGSATLAVQHSDRLARGDGTQAAHLVQYVLRARQNGVTLRSVQDDSTFSDLIHAVLMGERAHEDSARKAASVRDGIERRRAAGKSIGPVPYGYKAVPKIVEGVAVSRRLPDPQTAPVIVRMFDMLESGETFGAIARALNAEGIPAPRGAAWEPRRVREILLLRSYIGENGYQPLVDAERFERAHAQRRRMDPVAVARRSGNKNPSEFYLLRGILVCGECGHTMFTRRLAKGRTYTCGAVRQAKGTCSATAHVSAELIETAVLNRLGHFVGDVGSWLGERLEQHAANREDLAAAAKNIQADIRRTEREREKHLAVYRQLVADGAPTASIALEEVSRVDTSLDEQRRRHADALAMVEEFAGEVDADAVLDAYRQLQQTVLGKLDGSVPAEEMRATLQQLLTSIAVTTLPGDQEPPEGAGKAEQLTALLGGLQVDFRLVKTEAVERGDLPEFVTDRLLGTHMPIAFDLAQPDGSLSSTDRLPPSDSGLALPPLFVPTEPRFVPLGEPRRGRTA